MIFYIKIDNNRIPYSSRTDEPRVDESDYTEWIPIDGSYELMDNLWNYRYEEGQLILDENKVNLINHQAELVNKITYYKHCLDSTDYIFIKILEGISTREEYADVIAKRQEWRDEVNKLQLELEELDDGILY